MRIPGVPDWQLTLTWRVLPNNDLWSGSPTRNLAWMRPGSENGSSTCFWQVQMARSPWIDGALYPDMPVPDNLVDMGDRIDFLARLCAAWDFGILPDLDTVDEIRAPEWRDAVERCRLLTSPVYHLLRAWHDLSPLPYLGQRLAYIADDPSLEYV